MIVQMAIPFNGDRADSVALLSFQDTRSIGSLAPARRVLPASI